MTHLNKHTYIHTYIYTHTSILRWSFDEIDIHGIVNFKCVAQDYVYTKDSVPQKWVFVKTDKSFDILDKQNVHHKSMDEMSSLKEVALFIFCCLDHLCIFKEAKIWCNLCEFLDLESTANYRVVCTSVRYMYNLCLLRDNNGWICYHEMLRRWSDQFRKMAENHERLVPNKANIHFRDGLSLGKLWESNELMQSADGLFITSNIKLGDVEVEHSFPCFFMKMIIEVGIWNCEVQISDVLNCIHLVDLCEEIIHHHLLIHFVSPNENKYLAVFARRAVNLIEKVKSKDIDIDAADDVNIMSMEFGYEYVPKFKFHAHVDQYSPGNEKKEEGLKMLLYLFWAAKQLTEDIIPNSTLSSSYPRFSTYFVKQVQLYKRVLLFNIKRFKDFDAKMVKVRLTGLPEDIGFKELPSMSMNRTSGSQLGNEVIERGKEKTNLSPYAQRFSIYNLKEDRIKLLYEFPFRVKQDPFRDKKDRLTYLECKFPPKNCPDTSTLSLKFQLQSRSERTGMQGRVWIEANLRPRTTVAYYSTLVKTEKEWEKFFFLVLMLCDPRIESKDMKYIVEIPSTNVHQEFFVIRFEPNRLSVQNIHWGPFASLDQAQSYRDEHVPLILENPEYIPPKPVIILPFLNSDSYKQWSQMYDSSTLTGEEIDSLKIRCYENVQIKKWETEMFQELQGLVTMAHHDIIPQEQDDDADNNGKQDDLVHENEQESQFQQDIRIWYGMI